MTDKRILILMRIGDVPPEIEVEWNKWYDTEHIPNRLNIPGFLSARRFIAIEGEYKYLTLYDLNRLDVLTGEAYIKLRDWEASLPPESFEAITKKLPNCFRGIYEQIYPEQEEYQIPNTEILLAMGQDVPPDKESEFNAWYNTEHIPAMKRVPGFITARRFCTITTQQLARTGRTSSSPKFITLYDIEDEKVFESEALLRERNSPWSSWVRSWYSRRFRIVARRIYPKP